MSINFKEYYKTDECTEVVKYYKEMYDFYKEGTFGGEAIFSINTILLELCRILDSKQIYEEIFDINSQDSSKKRGPNYSIDSSIINQCDMNKLVKIDREKYTRIFGEIASKRDSRFIIVMQSNELPVKFKEMFIHYAFTIRKLGNYMPLPKLRMNGNTSGPGHTINQRKGNFNSYKDDPIHFYHALGEYITDPQNEKFKNAFNTIYGDNDEKLDGFLKKNYFCHLKDYICDEEYYLASRIGNSKKKKSNQEKLDGLYSYMYNACKIIDKRHKLIVAEYKKKNNN